MRDVRDCEQEGLKALRPFLPAFRALDVARWCRPGADLRTLQVLLRVSGRLLKNISEDWNRKERMGGVPGAGLGSQDPEQEGFCNPEPGQRGHLASEKSDHPTF